jgi:hypothetical protein
VARTDPLDELPVAYAVALRLHDAGASDTFIAVGLGIESEAVATMLDVARRKLDAARAASRGASPRDRQNQEPDG